jgi:hypothetical protein
MRLQVVALEFPAIIMLAQKKQQSKHTSAVVLVS